MTGELVAWALCEVPRDLLVPDQLSRCALPGCGRIEDRQEQVQVVGVGSSAVKPCKALTGDLHFEALKG
jgi:hypothetical protein